MSVSSHKFDLSMSNISYTTYESAVDIYDVTTGKWNSTAHLSVPRASLAAAAAGNKIVFAGGEYGASGEYGMNCTCIFTELLRSRF